MRAYKSHLGDYMRRWIFECWLGTVRLHHILRSDNDRYLHDHPWDFTSIILRGWYLEVTGVEAGTEDTRAFSGLLEPKETDASGHPVRSINRKKAEDAHRLILVPGTSVWTLVFTGPRRRRWGFYTRDQGWVEANRYFVEHGIDQVTK